MNYVPHSKTRNAKPMEVPLVSLEDYDGGDFMTYHERCGLQRWGVYKGQFGSLPPLQAQAFLQRWLWFGLLSQVTGCTRSTKDFAQPTGNGEFVLDASRVPNYLNQWHDRHKALSPEERLLDAQHTSQVIVEANSVVQLLSKFEQPPWLDGRVHLSLACLVEVLIGVHWRVCDNSALKRGRSRYPFLRNAMLNDNWCPFAVKFIQHSLGNLAQHFLYTAGPPMDGKDHSNCTHSICSASQIDPKDYRPSHVDECTGCGNLYDPDEEKVCQILREGDIPLITTKSKWYPFSSPEVVMTSTRTEKSYVAISHVWADGLGNVNGNKLPKCQLRRISTLTKKRPFWIDTLCVPNASGDDKVLALQKMAKVYENASTVLVLERGLQQISSKTEYAEIVFRIAMSSWSQRTWTLQEGALAQRPLFQLSDKAVDLLEIQKPYRRWLGPTYNFVPRVMGNDLKGAYMRLRAFSKNEVEIHRDESPDIIGIWNALQWRSTSRREDEETCIAILLGMDPSALTAVPRGHRLETLFSMRDEWPAEILFLPGERLKAPGRRWIPNSFFQRITTSYSPRRIGRRLDSGLQINTDEFYCLEAKYEKRVERHTYVIFTNQEMGEVMQVYFADDGNKATEPIRHQEFLANCPPYCTLFLIVARHLQPGHTGGAILCSMDKREGSNVFATYQRLVDCYHTRRSASYLEELADTAKHNFNLLGSRPPPGTKIIVG